MLNQVSNTPIRKQYQPILPRETKGDSSLQVSDIAVAAIQGQTRCKTSQEPRSRNHPREFYKLEKKDQAPKVFKRPQAKSSKSLFKIFLILYK